MANADRWAGLVLGVILHRMGGRSEPRILLWAGVDVLAFGVSGWGLTRCLAVVAGALLVGLYRRTSGEWCLRR